MARSCISGSIKKALPHNQAGDKYRAVFKNMNLDVNKCFSKLFSILRSRSGCITDLWRFLEGGRSHFLIFISVFARS